MSAKISCKFKKRGKENGFKRVNQYTPLGMAG